MIKKELKKYFGFDEFRPGQEEVVARIVKGDSALAIFPTGAGKSLCYQLPAMLLSGLTIVVSPLISLMKDQSDFLEEKGLAAARLDSTLDREAASRVLADAKSGKLKILMISVERFRNELFRNHLKQMNISLMVVDEAHCISEWGHNFRPDYLKIPHYRREYSIPAVLLLTATSTPDVTRDICGKFGIPDNDIVSTGFYRKNLHLHITPVSAESKMDALIKCMAEEPHGSSIVYVTLQKTADRVTQGLKAAGIPAESYHAGLKNDNRELIQNRFMTGETPVVVATIAFGMGIDKQDIRKVIHYDLPKSIENYSQETGRAGRDNHPSLCRVLGCRDNIHVLENFTYGDTPTFDGIHTLLTEIKNTPDTSWEIKLNTLSSRTDIKPLPLKTLLVYLEIRNIISPRYVYFEDYSFKYIDPPQAIINRFRDERQAFIGTIFSSTSTKKVFSYPDMDRIMSESDSPRSRIVTALTYLDEKGWIELSVKGAVDAYEILTQQFDPRHLAAELHQLNLEKETSEIQRIHNMLALFESDRCLNMNLCSYFGSPIPSPCGHCSVCTTGQTRLHTEQNRGIPQNADFNQLTKDLFQAAGHPDSIAVTRFLTGLISPALTKIKARRFQNFGVFESLRFNDVKTWVEQNINNK